MNTRDKKIDILCVKMAVWGTSAERRLEDLQSKKLNKFSEQLNVVLSEELPCLIAIPGKVRENNKGREWRCSKYFKESFLEGLGYEIKEVKLNAFESLSS